MKKIVFLLIFIFISWLSVSGQEYLTGLHSNPVLSAKSTRHINLKLATEIRLPFLDDFSYIEKEIPSDNYWADRFAFINSSYALFPPTIGVATFDALNDTGAVYPYAASTPFIADYLTSLPIRLDSLFQPSPTPISAGDSVYLSFYFQPQGVADAPNVNDSLILEFYAPNLQEWKKVWSHQGSTLADFMSQYGTYFKQVLIPVKDTAFLRKGFRIRFKNYASIAPTSFPSWQSNVDQWNVDYVYLNTGRNKSDTVYPDIAFVNPAPAILKDFTQIPARHFSNSMLADTLYLTQTNLNNTLTNMYYEYNVSQENGPFTYTKSGGVFDIDPYITHGYHDYSLHSKPSVGFVLPAFSNPDTAVFNITHHIHSNGWSDINIHNDTINHRQQFYNSYAYDDGTAENGYGLSGQSAKLAYRFTFSQSDTLGGVEMYFNETLNSPYFKYFYLLVWSSLSPENIIYKSKRFRPEFEEGINSFHTYVIDDTVLVLNGSFYVGWQQSTDDNLNVGFDRNTNSKNNTFFNVSGTWDPSVMDGSLMIRPMVGTNWQDKKIDTWKPATDFVCYVYPNPTNSGIINIGLPDNFNTPENRSEITIEIYDCMGKKVFESGYTNIINVEFLSRGVYLIRFNNYHTNESALNKLVITR